MLLQLKAPVMAKMELIIIRDPVMALLARIFRLMEPQVLVG
jgi:hypothetical protein